MGNVEVVIFCWLRSLLDAATFEVRMTKILQLSQQMSFKSYRTLHNNIFIAHCNFNVPDVFAQVVIIVYVFTYFHIN